MRARYKVVVVVAFAALVCALGAQKADDPQSSLSAVRAAVTRLNGEVINLASQLNTAKSSTDERFAGIQSSLVPVGAVIDWSRPKPTTPVPYGFMICNGDKVQDAQSPFNDSKVPDLTDRFVMGVTPSRLAETGGTAAIPPDGGHSHGIHGTGGYAPGEINYQRGPGHGDGFQIQYAADGVGPHNHGGENRPPYYGLIKIIRVK